MEAIGKLVEKSKEFPDLFNDSRFTANVIAIHGLVVLAMLVCFLLRRMIATGGHRLIERTGWKWIEPVAEYDYGVARGFARIHPRFQALGSEDEARREEIVARLDDIAEETGGREPEDGPLA